MHTHSKPKLRPLASTQQSRTTSPSAQWASEVSSFVFDGIHDPILSLEMFDGTVTGTLNFEESSWPQQPEFLEIRSSARNRHERRVAAALNRTRDRRAAL